MLWANKLGGCLNPLETFGKSSTGLLTRYILQPFETWLFQQQNKGKPPNSVTRGELPAADGLGARGGAVSGESGWIQYPKSWGDARLTGFGYIYIYILFICIIIYIYIYG